MQAVLAIVSASRQYLGQHFRARYVQASKSLTYTCSLVVSSIVPQCSGDIPTQHFGHHHLPFA